MTYGAAIGIRAGMSYPRHPMKITGRIALFVLASVALLLAHAATPHTLSPPSLQTVSRISDQGFTLPSQLEATIRAHVLSDHSVKTDRHHPGSGVPATITDAEKRAVYALQNPATVHAPLPLARVTNNPRDPPAA